MDFKIYVVFCLTGLSICESYFVKPGEHYKHHRDSRRSQSTKTCLCYPDASPTLVDKLDENENGLLRLVVFLYQDPNTGKTFIHIPNKDKQKSLPSLGYEDADFLQPLKEENCNIFNDNKHHSIDVRKHPHLQNHAALEEQPKVPTPDEQNPYPTESSLTDADGLVPSQSQLTLPNPDVPTNLATLDGTEPSQNISNDNNDRIPIPSDTSSNINNIPIPQPSEENVVALRPFDDSQNPSSENESNNDDKLPLTFSSKKNVLAPKLFPDSQNPTSNEQTLPADTLKPMDSKNIFLSYSNPSSSPQGINFNHNLPIPFLVPNNLAGIPSASLSYPPGSIPYSSSSLYSSSLPNSLSPSYSSSYLLTSLPNLPSPFSFPYSSNPPHSSSSFYSYSLPNSFSPSYSSSSVHSFGPPHSSSPPYLIPPKMNLSEIPPHNSNIIHIRHHGLRPTKKGNQNKISAPVNSAGLSPSEIQNPVKNDDSQFSNWLSPQITNEALDNAHINKYVLEKRIQNVLANNGIFMTPYGTLTDSQGNAIDWQNIKLRQILIGEPKNYAKTISSVNDIRRNVFFRSLIVTFGDLNKILGVIPMKKLVMHSSSNQRRNLNQIQVRNGNDPMLKQLQNYMRSQKKSDASFKPGRRNLNLKLTPRKGPSKEHIQRYKKNNSTRRKSGRRMIPDNFAGKLSQSSKNIGYDTMQENIPDNISRYPVQDLNENNERNVDRGKKNLQIGSRSNMPVGFPRSALRENKEFKIGTQSNNMPVTFESNNMPREFHSNNMPVGFPSTVPSKNNRYKTSDDGQENLEKGSWGNNMPVEFPSQVSNKNNEYKTSDDGPVKFPSSILSENNGYKTNDDEQENLGTVPVEFQGLVSNANTGFKTSDNFLKSFKKGSPRNNLPVEFQSPVLSENNKYKTSNNLPKNFEKGSRRNIPDYFEGFQDQNTNENIYKYRNNMPVSFVDIQSPASNENYGYNNVPDIVGNLGSSRRNIPDAFSNHHSSANEYKMPENFQLNGRRFIADSFSNIMSRVLKSDEVPPSDQLVNHDDDSPIDWRIIGGVAATSSGAPISSRGRSGYISF